MEERFTLYDILGYLIPGAISFFIFLKFINIFGLQIIDISIFKTWFGVALLIVLSYLVGHLIQWLTKYACDCAPIKNRWYVSSYYLRDDNKHYSPTYKKNLRKWISDYFEMGNKLEEAIKTPKHENSRKIIKESFDLTYTFLVQNKAAVFVEIFFALFGFCRGMFVVSIIGTFIELAGIALICSYPYLPNATEYIKNIPHLNLSIILLLVFLASAVGFFNRAEKFSGSYVDYVYRSFYTYISKKDNEVTP